MKLWLCGDHHTGTTFFYQTFFNLARATNEKYFTTTAVKEFAPNHFNTEPGIIPQKFKTQYDKSSPLEHIHEKFIKTASNFKGGGVEEGCQRLHNMFSCYSGVNLLVSEPTNFLFDTIDLETCGTIYDKFLGHHKILLVFIVRNPVDIECSRWARKLISYTKNKSFANSEKYPIDNFIKDQLLRANYLDRLEYCLLNDEKFLVNIFPRIASSVTRNSKRKHDSSYYSYYSKLIKWAQYCNNIKITTYEKLFADARKSVQNISDYFAPHGEGHAELTLKIDKINTSKINPSNKLLIFSDEVKKKMKNLHRDGVMAWEEVSLHADPNSSFLN